MYVLMFHLSFSSHPSFASAFSLPPRRLDQLSDRMTTFPTSLAAAVERGTEPGQFPGPDPVHSGRGTPDFIQFGKQKNVLIVRSLSIALCVSLIALRSPLLTSSTAVVLHVGLKIVAHHYSAIVVNLLFAPVSDLLLAQCL